MAGTAMPSSHEEVRVDENAEHAEAFVEFNETHATHICSKIVDGVATIHGLDTGVFEFQIEREVLGLGKTLIPLPLGFFIHGSDLLAIGKEGFYEFAADESAGAGYEYGMGVHCLSVFCCWFESFGFLWLRRLV